MLREVMNASPGDDDAIEMARRLHDSIVKGRVFDQPAEDIGRMVRVLDARLVDYRLTPDKRDQLVSEIEIYARDLATRAHVAAKDSQDRQTLGGVANAYRAYLARFDTSASHTEMQQNLAETLLASRRYYEAGRAYEDVAVSAGDVKDATEARLNAISAYQKALEDSSLGRLERAMAWAGVRALGRQVIRETPGHESVMGIKLSIARSVYEAGDYDHAAQLFFAVAMQYPSTTEGTAAAHLTLDSLRQADDLEGIATMGRRLIANARLGNEGLKAELRDIVSKAAQRQVAEVTVTDTGDREEQLLGMAKRHKGSELGEQAFYNTLLVARSNGEIERFYELGHGSLGQCRSGQGGQVHGRRLCRQSGRQGSQRSPLHRGLHSRRHGRSGGGQGDRQVRRARQWHARGRTAPAAGALRESERARGGVGIEQPDQHGGNFLPRLPRLSARRS